MDVSSDLAAGEVEFDKSKITHYIEHPVPVKPPTLENPAAAAQAKQVFLTPRERKKLRKIRRAEIQTKKQEDLMTGRRPPDPPKATLANMMRIYGQEAYQDPTRIEQLVREQMQQRLDKHEAHNAEHKLTPQQRTEKKLKKLPDNHNASTISVALYKIANVRSPLHRKKIDHLARDAALTGCLLMVVDSEVNVLVAEGSAKALRKLKGLMLRRIKWADALALTNADAAHSLKSGSTPAVSSASAIEGNVANNDEDEDDDDEDDEDDYDDDESDEDESEDEAAARRGTGGNTNLCSLVWEGILLKRQFRRFRFKLVSSEVEASAYMTRCKVPHYWNMAKNFSPALAD